MALTALAHHHKQVNAHNERAWQAWHTAGMQRAKTMPPLRKLMMKQPQKPLTLEAQLEGLKSWVQATGGKVIYRGAPNG